MIRNLSLEELSDGKLYSSADMVKAGCNDCKGCHECCTGMGDTILLDPWDIMQLCKITGESFEELLDCKIELNIQDGMILPNIKMVQDQCPFLNEEGRCSIHKCRPGFCRLFPLGRYYEEDGFRYFLQIHECARAGRVKVKVSKWLDIPNLERYEAFVYSWHLFQKQAAKLLSEHADDFKGIGIFIIQNLYVMPYEEETFYQSYAERLKRVCEILGIPL